MTANSTSTPCEEHGGICVPMWDRRTCRLQKQRRVGCDKGRDFCRTACPADNRTWCCLQAYNEEPCLSKGGRCMNTEVGSPPCGGQIFSQFSELNHLGNNHSCPTQPGNVLCCIDEIAELTSTPSSLVISLVALAILT